MTMEFSNQYVDPNVPAMYNSQAHDGGEYQLVQQLMADRSNHFGVSTLHFDTHEELLWSGSGEGHITSYHGQHMQKYTSFHIHATDAIRQMASLEGRVLALTKDQLRCSVKEGRTVFDFRGENVDDMQCMLVRSPTSLLLGGHHTRLINLDLTTGKAIKQVEVSEPGCAIMRQLKNVVYVGDSSGRVTLRDDRAWDTLNVIEAHSASLSDFDVHGNMLVTCGFGSRMGNMAVDRFLMTYDLRMMRALGPVQMMYDPIFVRFIPAYSSRLVVVSPMGQYQMMEAGSQPTGEIFQIDTMGQMCTAFEVASTYQSMCFADAGGFLHLYSSTPEATYNSYSTPTEFPQPPNHIDPIPITDEHASLASVPMFYPSTGKLFSDWPEHLGQRVYRIAKPIDSQLLQFVKMIPGSNSGYAPNIPGTRIRNLMPYKSDNKTDSSKNRSTVPDSPMGRGDDPFVVVPKRYRQVEIKYSKLGVEDFDFRHYNKTNFAGLETHIPNAYCNSMLQALYFVEPLRCYLLSHTCDKEFCLSCELGMLFHMLDLQKGQTCQASNFLRAFRTIPEASALGLVLGDAEEIQGKVNFPRLIQSWNRFILQQVHAETQDKEEEAGDDGELNNTRGSTSSDTLNINIGDTPKNESEDSIISKLFGMEVKNTFRCRCGVETLRETMSTIVSLTYYDSSGEGNLKPTTFSQVLQNSMSSEQTTQAWCNKCQKYQPHVQSKCLKAMPDIMAINCHLDNDSDLQFWQYQEQVVKESIVPEEKVEAFPSKPCRFGNGCTRKGCHFFHERDKDKSSADMDMNLLSTEDPARPSWLPFGVMVKTTEDGDIQMQDIMDEEEIPIVAEEGIVYYRLHGSVAHIKEAKSGGHLVSHVNVREPYHQRKERVTCTQWYLFNDFSITPIEKYGAVHFDLDWKVPCVIYFVKVNLSEKYDLTVQNPMDSKVLFVEENLVTPRRKRVTFTPLADDEVPKDGDLVGLDAEFVTLNQEEAELRSDGTRSTIKPSQMSVARISCIRGHGALEGEAFIDDYISTQEQVVDYLTQFSGIQPGDLDATLSSKHLTTLKSTYCKLRYLIDAGVKFVGHGLKKDFRVINIVVPKGQVVDTVDLFRLPRQRMISLKFLAWYFLKTNIQSVTHDSIEDAKTALKLYKRYMEIEAQGPDSIKETLKSMYEKGRALQWKIPEGEDSPTTAVETPPSST